MIWICCCVVWFGCCAVKLDLFGIESVQSFFHAFSPLSRFNCWMTTGLFLILNVFLKFDLSK